ncbi:MAG: 3-hydroxybutyryl-CoA dehydrogenase [Streptosporangiaceae bacterium]|jgi:3-hydroxybutyryl-CoA dehydrogenase
MDVREVAVVGFGTMGAGIAEVFVRAGIAVVAIEVDPAALEQGKVTLDRSLGKAVTRGKLTEQEKTEILSLVRPVGSVAEAAAADLVVEVVPERMEIKRQVFAELDRVCRPEAILTTNTSSLSVTAIAAGTRLPGRVAGLHFFNPAQVMRLVEVVTTVSTAPETGQAVTDLVRRLGKTPVQVADRAGFIVNALLLPYLNQAARMLETGYATREDIDAAATAGIGLPMGPLALLDLIGLDTALSILEVLHGEFGGPRFSAAPMLRRLVEAGLTGRKTGRGFYDYETKEPGQRPGPGTIINGDDTAGPATVTLIGGGAGPGTPLGAMIAAAGWPLAADPGGPGPHEAGPGGGHRGGAPDDNDPDIHHPDIHHPGAGFPGLHDPGVRDPGAGLPRDAGPDRLIIVHAKEPSAGVLGAALATGRPADAVGLHLAGDKLAELISTPMSAPRAIEAAAVLAGRLGVAVVRCKDRPGFLAGALLYPHLNDAVRMVQDGYASAADIDTAMTLGCGYPRGPMQLLDAAGAGPALAVLTLMHERYGDPAFAPAPLLAEHAAARQAFC